MNKPIYLGILILDISKTLMYDFCYDYIKLKYEDKARLCYMDTDSFVINIKPKYQDKAKLCYADTDSFIIHIETEDFYKDIANYVEKWFDTSNFDESDNIASNR